ncbi:MAG: 2-C-methyl-D-erythritol 2,4-cyclodiphosphate synthase [Gammaproteobacteria bacterium]|nr:2-C-methyl-D-erythritol 2,4-cyclodiphosphate synthase [Gammaproteobacteria bacterium]
MKTGIGQDSHRFELSNSGKKLMLAGVHFPEHLPLAGNSDADVVLHAITNAVSGITGINILGAASDDLCKNRGITDSRVYLKEALNHLTGQRISHISISIECKTPKIAPRIPSMKQSIAKLLGISEQDIGITATSGEGLTAFGRGEGIQVFAIMTTVTK